MAEYRPEIRPHQETNNATNQEIEHETVAGRISNWNVGRLFKPAMYSDTKRDIEPFTRVYIACI